MNVGWAQDKAPRRVEASGGALAGGSGMMDLERLRTMRKPIRPKATRPPMIPAMMPTGEDELSLVCDCAAAAADAVVIDSTVAVIPAPARTLAWSGESLTLAVRAVASSMVDTLSSTLMLTEAATTVTLT